MTRSSDKKSANKKIQKQTKKEIQALRNKEYSKSSSSEDDDNSDSDYRPSNEDDDESTVYETEEDDEEDEESEDTEVLVDKFIHGKITKNNKNSKGKGNGKGDSKKAAASSPKKTSSKKDNKNEKQKNSKKSADKKHASSSKSKKHSRKSESESESESEEEDSESEDEDEYDSEEDSEEEGSEEEEDSEEESEEEEEIVSPKHKKGNKKDDKKGNKKGGILVMNIMDMLEGATEDDEDYVEDEFAEEYETDEDEELNTDDEKTFMKETYVEQPIASLLKEEDKKKRGENHKLIDSTSEEEEQHICTEEEELAKKLSKCIPAAQLKNGNPPNSKPSKKESKKEDKKDKTKEDKTSEENKVVKKYQTLDDMRKFMLERLAKDPENKILKNALQDIKENIRKLVKKARSDNARKFHEMVSEKIYSTGKINDLDYFKKKLSNKEQLRAMSDLKEINEHIYLDKPYRMAILEMDISYKHKAVALSRLDAMKQMEISAESGGYTKMKEWLDTFMRIPFGRYRDLPVRISDGHDKCYDFMHRAKQTLDECTYGMNDAKMQIMQVLGNWISNPSSTGTAIAIRGPAGTGKTTLCRDGISKILGREFAFITLGGATDSAFLDGFSYTYEGAKWGKIVQILIDSKSMNPVIYFDELDKISTTERGQEISGILTHLTDTSQNNQFHDKYFSEVDFDLSRCLFIFSYNEEALVNPILKDRMYVVETKGYSNKEKVIIAQKYLLPKILEQVFFRPDEVVIPDETIQYILEKPDFIVKEEGVRNLKRALEIIVKKLNLLRLMTTTPSPATTAEEGKKSTSGVQLFGEEFKFEVKFPMTIGKEHVDSLIKRKDTPQRAWDTMFV